MFSLSDALPMQNYPSKVWFLCVAVQISAARDNLFVSYRSVFVVGFTRNRCVAARFVTMARFVTKVTKLTAMPARFVPTR